MSDAPSHDPTTTDGTASVDPQSIEGIFLAALAKEGRATRESFLNETCAGDAEKRQRVEALLRAYDDAGSFFEKPPLAVDTVTQSVDFDFLEPSDDPSLIGKLGPYEIYEMIGRGGMGIVFRARDPKLNRVVAVKVLAPELAVNPNARRRFVREAQAGAAISHPHVVTIHAVENEEKLPFLVMECIVGQSLQQKIDKIGSLRLIEMLRISKQIAEGLAAAHHQGLIHRDIKPANILLENGVERVKITDFGLARLIDDVSVTRTGEVTGSPQFMSPEQASGDRVDQRSDLFSLGCVMYAMCAGRSPFRATSIAAAIRRVCDDEPRPLAEINPEVPVWMIEIIEKLLRKNPDERFQSADELVRVLESRLAGIGNLEVSPRVAATKPLVKPSKTVELSPETVIGEEFPILETLSSSFLRLALLGPLMTLLLMFVWAMFPSEIDSQYVPLILVGLGPVLWGAAIIGWLGSHVNRIEWGSEAAYKGSVAGILALATPPLWILGIPTGLLALWVLNQPSVREVYKTHTNERKIVLSVPAYLLDVGMLLGAAVTSLIALLMFNDHRFSITDVLEAFSVVLVLGVLVLPLRGKLYRNRFVRDFAILLSAFSIVATVFWLFCPNRPPMGINHPIEAAIAMFLLGLVIGLPCLVIWGTAVKSWRNESTVSQSILPPTVMDGEPRSRTASRRVVAGAMLLITAVIIQVILVTNQKYVAAPRTQLVIHYVENIKPIAFEIDGVPARPSQRSETMTILDIQPGLHELKVAMLGNSSDVSQQAMYRISVSPGQTHEITLRLPIKLDAGMELGPASKDYGGLILEISDPGLQVMLFRSENADIGFLETLMSAGIHQVPAGNYQVVAIDTQAGWLLDVKGDPHNKQSYEQVFNTLNSIYQTNENAQKMYDPESGTWSIVQYTIANISIEVGEFTSLEVQRDLAAISRQHDDFVERNFYRYLWNGKKYSFTGSQAVVINQLLKAYAEDRTFISETELLKAVLTDDSESMTSITLKGLFQDGRHPAWSEIFEFSDDENDGWNVSLVALKSQELEPTVDRLVGTWVAKGTEKTAEPVTMTIEKVGAELDANEVGWLMLTFTDVGGNLQEGALVVSPAKQMFILTVRHEDRSRHVWGGKIQLTKRGLNLKFEHMNTAGARSSPIDWSRIAEYEFSPRKMHSTYVRLEESTTE